MRVQNGVGKTAIARVLAGLWAPESGTVSRPERGYNGVFVVPQRAYMVVGSLKDQCVSRTIFQCASVADNGMLQDHLSALRITVQEERKDVGRLEGNPRGRSLGVLASS